MQQSYYCHTIVMVDGLQLKIYARSDLKRLDMVSMRSHERLSVVQSTNNI